jgi:hypothetical protein
MPAVVTCTTQVSQTRFEECLIDGGLRRAFEQPDGYQALQIEITRAESLAVVAFQPHEAARRQRLRFGIECQFVGKHPGRAGPHAPAFARLETKKREFAHGAVFFMGYPSPTTHQIASMPRMSRLEHFGAMLAPHRRQWPR